MSLLSDHIREFEGLRLSAYRCPAGVLTIGYGHTGPDVRENMTISQARAEELLSEDMAWVRQCIADTVKVPLDAGQEAAISSLIYNIGGPNWRKSTVLRRLNNRNYLGAADALGMWNKARVNGKLKVLPGLVRRREAERAMFLAGNLVQDADDMPQDVHGGEERPMVASKEQAVGVVGALGSVGMIWGQVKASVPEVVTWAAPYLPWVLAGLFLAVLANRWYARKKGER